MKKILMLLMALCIGLLSFGQRPLVGAIRWDAWNGDNPAVINDPGEQVERSLGPNQYHFRLPFYGVEVGTNEVDAKGNTQAIMDREINYAKFAGIDYWAFVYYPTEESNLGDARNFYDASTLKNNIKYCYIVDYNLRMPASNFSYLVSKFGESNYQKVLGNRPIFYLFSPGIYSASEITTLRNMTTAAGLGTPYIVVMDFSAGSASSGATTIGADAISSYATTQGGGGPYSGLVSAEVTSWNNYKNTGKNVIPWVTTGWDPRPRIDNPVTWTSYASNGWTQTATTTEIANHLQEALNWVTNNSAVVNANTVLMYAWNEFDEGGWIAPTKVVGSSAIDTSRIVAIRAVTSSCSQSSNLALCKTYSSSSNWDAGQTADKACDGNSTTNWQAASGSSFNGQWVQVNFGTATTFDSVRLSEYGNRTSGYRIEYSTNGTTWQTAYTGTTIGTGSAVSFAAVTGSYARIYFTGGSNTPIIYEFEIYKKPPPRGSTNLALNKTYSSSSNWDASQTADKACDGNSTTNWQAAGGSSFNGQWVQVNFGTATAFDSVRLSEFGNRTSGYRIKYSTNGTTWQTAYTGTTIGTGSAISFAAVTGNYARIYFTAGSNTPIIYEFEIYKKPSSSNPNLALNKTYRSSSNWDAGQTADKACDGLSTTNWQAASGSTFNGQWLQVNFGTATTFNRVTLSEYGNRTTGYRIKYSTNGTTWQTAFTGTTIGGSTTVNFAAVTGNYARVFFTGGSYTPIIYEFEIYNNGTGNRVAPITQPIVTDNITYPVTVYPNPSRGNVSVGYQLAAKSQATVSVFNIEGRIVKQINFTSANAPSGNIDMDVSDLSNGTYFVKIKSGNQSVTQKLIIEK